MRIRSHIAVQITALVLTGGALATLTSREASMALEARAQIEDDARHLEAVERMSDSVGHVLLIGDLVLSGGTTYLIPIAEVQADGLHGIVGSVSGAGLLDGFELALRDVERRIDQLVRLIVSSESAQGEDRDLVLFGLLTEFDSRSLELTDRIAALRSGLAEAVDRRRVDVGQQLERIGATQTLALAGFLLAVGASWSYLALAIARPIRDLARRANAARGGAAFEAPNEGPTEVRELGSGIAQFVEGLEDARRGLEETVATRTAELHRALRARAAFLANTSHELRTPLNAIIGFADLMADPEVEPDDRGEYLELIRGSSRHLLNLIEDVLDLSKIDAGRMGIEQVVYEPRELAAEVRGMLSEGAERKGVRLAFEFSDAVPSRLVGDPTRLRQILVNLVGNAIKFTSEGAVTVRLEHDGPELDTVVEDTGVGIPADKIATIFEAFEQADVSDTRRFGGTGLGLAISRRLARLMGGDLTATSEEGVGCSFRLQLPAPEASVSAAVTPTTKVASPGWSGPAGTRLLLVDDVPTNRLLGRRMLERMGFEVDEAVDGAEAVAAVKSAESPYAAVLMDLQMPVLNGYEATRQLREFGFGQPILALSAAVLPEQRAAALRAGCNAFVSKPLSADELSQALGRALDRAA